MVFLHSEPKCGRFLGLQAVCWNPSPSRIRLGSRRRLTLSPQQTDRTEISRLGSDMPPAPSVLYCAHPAPRVYAPARYLLMILKWSREWSTAWVGCTKIVVAHQGIEGERNIARFPDCRSFAQISITLNISKKRTSSMAIDAATNSFRIIPVGGGIAGPVATSIWFESERWYSN